MRSTPTRARDIIERLGFLATPSRRSATTTSASTARLSDGLRGEDIPLGAGSSTSRTRSTRC
jgi:hypothetical protein